MRTTGTRRFTSRSLVMWALAALAVMLVGLGLTACGTEAEESAVPLNVLPEEGQAVVYEFYTDS